MLEVDVPHRDEVDALQQKRAPACVSIYLPTDPRSGGAAERVELRQLADLALGRLAKVETSPDLLAAIEGQIDDLLADQPFWAHQARTLAMFLAPDRAITYRLPNRLRKSVSVADRFDVSQLLRALTFPETAVVLALAAGSVRVLSIAPGLPWRVVSVPGMPDNLASVGGLAWSADQPLPLRFRGDEGQKLRLRHYARRVERALRPVLAESSRPLILAAAEPLDGIFRSVCRHPALVAESVPGNPESMSDDELVSRARGVLDQWNAARLGELRRRYAECEAHGRTATDAAELARLACRGAIDTLFFDFEAKLPGTVDDVTGAVALDDADGVATSNVLAEISRRTWLTGGRVLALRHGEVPGGGASAAILRYLP